MKRYRCTLLMLLSVGIVLASIYAASAQTSNGTTVEATPSTEASLVGESFTVNITISNVQNLYSIDVTLNWNASLLQATNTDLRLGVESNHDGVLHESSPDANINVAINEISQETGTYHLVATSVNPASSFNGSGTIAIITFNVTDAGHSDLIVHSELADHPLPEESSNFIEHTDLGSSVETSVIPEFPEVAVLGCLVVLVTVGLLVSKPKSKRVLF